MIQSVLATLAARTGRKQLLDPQSLFSSPKPQVRSSIKAKAPGRDNRDKVSNRDFFRVIVMASKDTEGLVVPIPLHGCVVGKLKLGAKRGK